MNLRLPSLVIGLLISSFSTVSGAETQLDSTFRTFSKCDGKFFAELGSNAEEMRALAPVKLNKPIGWFEVKNRRDDKDSFVKMANASTIAGVSVLSYHDLVTELGTAGSYYFWGFVFKGAPKDVLEKIRPLVSNGERIELDGDVYVRSEISFMGTPFVPNKPQNGVPKPLTTERVLTLEEDTDGSGGAVTNVFCSLQGNLSRKQLEEIRPDLNPADYPANLNHGMFDKTPTPPQTLLAATDLLTSRPYLKPKFKRMNYVIKVNQSEVKINLEALPSGLVRQIETYSAFELVRESVAGQVLLKYMVTGLGEDLIVMAEKLTAGFPEKFIPQAAFQFANSNTTIHKNTKEPGETHSHKCQVLESFEAKEIHPNLTGMAFATSCEMQRINAKDEVLEKNTDSHPVFLEDFGVFIPGYQKVRGAPATSRPVFSKLDIEL